MTHSEKKSRGPLRVVMPPASAVCRALNSRKVRSVWLAVVLAWIGVATGFSRSARAIEAGMPNPPAKPTVVEAAIMILDVVDIDDVNESFVAEIALFAEWDDPRLAFDAEAEGVDVKIFQGNFQFAEVFTGWWPQLLLVNEVGPPDPNAVKVEVYPNGHVRYIDQHNAVLETPMDLRDYPFDQQHLRAELVPFGDMAANVVLKVHPTYADATEDFVKRNADVNVAGWVLTGVDFETDETFLNAATNDRRISRLVATIHLERRSWQLVWQMLFPLLVIVSMIWSIFWLDIDSLADRLNVAFVGVLTIVAYQFVVIDNMPRMSYLTLTDTILLISFVTMSLAIPQSLIVAGLVKRGAIARAMTIDRVSRMAFPLTYMGLLAAVVAWYRLT